ncbi:MAG: methylmalonyl-CoA mutase family protein, partial [Gammaproteobacteria bacterium]
MTTARKPADAPVTRAAQQPLRFVTAASLFDGHDAAINIMRRIIQGQGAEVVHLGHNRSVEDVVRAALQEDADGIAISSYQGGHMEYFKYMVDMLKERHASHIRVFGGGGGTITPEEIAELHDYGVERIYHPNDGMHMGLGHMIEDVVQRAEKHRVETERPAKVALDDEISVGKMLSAIEEGALGESELAKLRKEWEFAGKKTPVVGVTGTGGAGKSSVVDELLLRFLQAFPEMRIAVLAVDPTRRRTGGALLGDRIRMNSLRSQRVFMRSMATRRQHAATSVMLHDCIGFLRGQGYDLVIVETAGIGQSDSEIVDLVDFATYVMTSDYGAASQLEKIDMLDYAELVVLNKFDRRGAEDALRDVKKQWKRNRTAFKMPDDEVPVYPTIASQFNDPGITWMFVNLCLLLREKLKLAEDKWTPQVDTSIKEPRATVLIPGARVRYLAEIAEQGRGINTEIEREADAAGRAQHFYEVLREFNDPKLPKPLGLYESDDLNSVIPEKVGSQPNQELDSRLRGNDKSKSASSSVTPAEAGVQSKKDSQTDSSSVIPAEAGIQSNSDSATESSLIVLRQRYNAAIKDLSGEALDLLREWPARLKSITDEHFTYQVRGKAIEGNNYIESLSHQKIPKIAAPHYKSWADLLRFLMRENLPGAYPYTGGVYPYRRTGEDPTRMFAGEGTPERTNRRFHYLSHGQDSARLSTAFDSVTLYGEDPAERPDIYGKIGNSGVSIATLNDMKKLYSGFDLCASKTSVSMTINGPAPMILAMFMNTAIDQQVEKYLKADPKRWAAAEQKIADIYKGKQRPHYTGELPDGNDGLGLGLLGVTGDEVVDRETYDKIKAETLHKVRGTVQADILKEDQAQNTCIFSTEFALRMMGDIQQYFVDKKVRNFYSVSISGYHIAEAGANPISQLAFTLSNGFTIVEYYLARGMKIDDFAPNLSFFFSNGLDPEYSVIGRVARRIWARAMRERYGASARSQMMKYHIQT